MQRRVVHQNVSGRDRVERPFDERQKELCDEDKDNYYVGRTTGGLVHRLKFDKAQMICWLLSNVPSKTFKLRVTERDVRKAVFDSPETCSKFSAISSFFCSAFTVFM